MLHFFFCLVISPLSFSILGLLANVCFMIGYASLFYKEVAGDDAKELSDTGSTGSQLKLRNNPLVNFIKVCASNRDS